MICFEAPGGGTDTSVSHIPGEIRIALVNNMPDAALRQTERQFGGLLGVTGVPVRFRRYTLDGIRRGQPAAALIGRYYFPIEDLWASPPDAVIVTGCEPLSPDLSAEVYWDQLVGLLRWAREHTVSTLASCLAAHATVLAFDGIRRRLLPEKRSGVFPQGVASEHALCAGLPGQIAVPHSRMNDVSTMALVACGYQPVISSAEIGWSVAVKEDRHHLCVLMQGHPEYEADTLMLEYRRDVRRFIDGERAEYPQLPAGCVPPEMAERFEELRRAATARDRDEDLMASFPMDSARNVLVWSWRRVAETLYRNWLNTIRIRMDERALARA